MTLRIPPFSAQAAQSLKFDPTSAGGAAILAERIEKVWAAHGGKVKTRVEMFSLGSASNGAVYCVRSDLVAGMPRSRR